MPCRRSHFASSKPFDGPGGARSSPRSRSRAPCGGERPSGSSSRAGSCGAQRSPAKHERLHPLVERPRPRRLLDLHHRPLRRADPGREHAVVELSQPHASPGPRDGDDRGRERRRSQARARGCETDGGEGGSRDEHRKHRRTRDVRQREAETESADERVRETHRHLTGSRVPSAAPCAPARCRARLRARRPRGTRRAPAGSRGSSARSPGRLPAGSPAARASPSSGRAAPTARSRLREGSPPRHRPAPRPGTMTCSPSATGAARLTESSCALAVGPPAAAIASSILDPDRSR